MNSEGIRHQNQANIIEDCGRDMENDAMKHPDTQIIHIPGYQIAEQIYKIPRGIIRDLTKCLRQLAQTGRIEDFELGQDDVSEKFQIPQRLYGREAEVASLLATFDKAAPGGEVEYLLVQQWGKRLNTQSSRFQLDELPKTLCRFPNITQQISTLISLIGVER